MGIILGVLGVVVFGTGMIAMEKGTVDTCDDLGINDYYIELARIMHETRENKDKQN